MEFKNVFIVIIIIIIIIILVQLHFQCNNQLLNFYLKQKIMTITV